MSQRSPFNKRNAPAATEEEASKSGMARKSPSRAKPARAAAETVRVVSSSSKSKGKSPAGSRAPEKLTKEERKAKRKAERMEEDEVATVANLVMKSDELYNKRRHLWWVFLVLGLVFVFVTFGAGYIGSPDGSNMYDVNTIGGKISVVSLILAYLFIIVALVYEFMKIRPIRNAALEKTRSMSHKKRRALVEESYEAEERKRAEKAARKAKK